jgi:hypothetical protein
MGRSKDCCYSLLWPDDPHLQRIENCETNWSLVSIFRELAKLDSVSTVFFNHFEFRLRLQRAYVLANS